MKRTKTGSRIPLFICVADHQQDDQIQKVYLWVSQHGNIEYKIESYITLRKDARLCDTQYGIGISKKATPPGAGAYLTRSCRPCSTASETRPPRSRSKAKRSIIRRKAAMKNLMNKIKNRIKRAVKRKQPPVFDYRVYIYKTVLTKKAGRKR